MMELMDSESLTPPGSPLIGYSGCGSRTSTTSDYSSPNHGHGNESYLPIAESFPVYHFMCKGPLLGRTSDNSFSLNGLFLRNQAIAAVKLLKKSQHDAAETIDNDFDSQPLLCDYRISDAAKQLQVVYTFFGHHKFNPFDAAQFRILMKMVQKRIFTLVNVAKPNFVGCSVIRKSSAENTTVDPFQIRRDICEVFTLLTQERSQLISSSNHGAIVMSDQKVHDLFNGVRKCLGTVSSTWSSTLKFHCGSKEGNNCTSPEFHLFHLHLELRWALLIISGLNSSILAWVVQDLIELAYLRYHSNSRTSLEDATPFNCYCVKELWAMLRVVVDRVNPAGKQFWDVIIQHLGSRCQTIESNTSFPLWMLSHLVSVYDYEFNGIFSLLAGVNDEFSSSKGASCYAFLNQLLKTWLQDRSCKTTDALHYIRRCIPYWGFDMEVLATFWAYWLPRLDKGFELDSMRHFRTAAHWFKIISEHIGSDNELREDDEVLSSDPFFEFLNLLYLQIQQCNNKDWKKLKSSLCNRVTPKIVGSFNEFGLARVSTMFMVLAYGKDDCLSMCERLNETLNYTKHLFLQTKLRARCTMVLLLLAKSINVTSIAQGLVKSIDETIITSANNSAQKDIVMIYIEMLELLPSYGAKINLGQSKVIPNNLTAWLASCGHNYAVRTLQMLHSLFENWILSESTEDSSAQLLTLSNDIVNNEKAKIGELIEARTLPYVKQSVTLGPSQLITDFDIKSYADLAADFTIVHGLLQHSNLSSDIVAKLFEFFAVNDKVSPNVSERYVLQIIKSKVWSWNRIISDNLLVQCWIRLVFFNYDIPLQLSVHVFSLNNNLSFQTITTNAETLLGQFCQIINECEDYWNRNHIHNVLSPIATAGKIISTSSSSTNNSSSAFQGETKLRLEAFIKSCSLLLRKVKFDKIYTRNSQSSFVHQILDNFCPPFVGKLPWERLPTNALAALRKYIPEFSFSIILFDSWKRDPYLKRKFSDIVRFALLGFINSEELDSANPALVILEHCEKHPESEYLLQEVSSCFQNFVSKEVPLTKKYLLAVLGFLKRHMPCTVVALLPAVLEIIMDREIEYTNICTNIFSHTVATIMSGRINNYEALKQNLNSLIDKCMTKYFAFRSRKFFDICSSLITLSPNSSAKALPFLRRFVKFEMIPMIQNYIHISEAKQASGVNFSLRNQLADLERRLTDVTAI